MLKTHHRGRVVQRVVELGPLLRVRRRLPHLRPDHGPARLLDVELRPADDVVRMRPEENGRFGEAFVGADPAEPLAHEDGLVAGDEERRAQIDDERARRVEVVKVGELLPRRARLPVEPVVEAVRAHGHDALARDAVQADRLLDLKVVPDDGQRRRVVEQTLVREVVPARDRQHGRDAEIRGGAEIVAVGRAEPDERRDQHDIGIAASSDVLLHPGGDGHGSLRVGAARKAEPTPQSASSASRERGRPLARARACARARAREAGARRRTRARGSEGSRASGEGQRRSRATSRASAEAARTRTCSGIRPRTARKGRSCHRRDHASRPRARCAAGGLARAANEVGARTSG